MLNICSIHSQYMLNICSIYAQAARMTVKLDGDIIMGEIAATADKRYLNPQYGSLEDMGWVQKINDRSRWWTDLDATYHDQP